jgi:hypothetical protein
VKPKILFLKELERTVEGGDMGIAILEGGYMDQLGEVDKNLGISVGGNDVAGSTSLSDPDVKIGAKAELGVVGIGIDFNVSEF